MVLANKTIDATTIDQQELLEQKKLFVKIIFCTSILVIPIFAPLLKKVFAVEEFDTNSKNYVQTHLSTDFLVEVIPIKDELAYGNFLTEELPKRAKFYAKITNGKKVLVYIQFHDEDEKILYNKFSYIDFARYFKPFIP